MESIKINLPFTDEIVSSLKAGDSVLLTGYIFTGRDAAHKRIIELLDNDKELPFDIKNQTIYYVGPAPAKPGYVVGPAGPTTSYRMDPYTPKLLDRGLKAMIGKGLRSNQVIESMIRNNAVYLAAIGGAAALISKTIKSIEIICYEDLSSEAVHKLYVEDFPAIVVIDSKGNNLYQR